MNCNTLYRITICMLLGLSCLNQGCASGVTDNSQGTDDDSDDSQALVLEPDDFPASTPLTNALAAVTLSTALDDNSISMFEITASEDGLDLEPTGEQVFGHADIPFFNSSRRLRLDFNLPVREVSVTFGGGTFFETEVGVFQAFDANNIMVAEYTTVPLESGVSEIMTISRPTGDIAWAVAYSQDSFGRLDYLKIKPAIAP